MLIHKLIICVDHFRVSLRIQEQVVLFEYLQLSDEVVELRQSIASYHLYRCSSADLEGKGNILKAYDFVFF